MQLIEVDDKIGIELFHAVAKEQYQDDPNYVAPLRMEIESLFDAKKNRLLEHGDAARWVLSSDSGHLLGRVSAFVNYRMAEKSDLHTGGVGFFVCENNQESANLLFDVAKEWLSEHKCLAMDGNINFGENFANWGVLVEGFMPQAYGMPYNKPYYRELFENYGFKDYFQQLSYHVDLRKPFPARMIKFAEYLETRPGYSFEPYSRKKNKKFLPDFVSVLNETWADYMEDFAGLEEDDIAPLLESAKDIIVEDFIWFAYKDGKPIAVTVAFPDVNQILIHFDGKLNFFKAMKFLYLKKRKTMTRNRVLLAGVIPEFQNSGVIAALFLQFIRSMKNRPEYTEMELSWVGDYNPRMQKIYEQIGGVAMKKHITFRYLFDSTTPFVRFTNEKGNSALRKDVVAKG
ncbi:MAG: hypothetical protein J7L96_01510 [Bacteroidales bacterium]|nr:hypothetical protein [Bacteroidales bacterium]